MLFFICDEYDKATRFGSIVINKIGSDLKLINQNEFNFCWIVDFPMFEIDEETKKLEFSHNLFQCHKEEWNHCKSRIP